MLRVLNHPKTKIFRLSHRSIKIINADEKEVKISILKENEEPSFIKTPKSLHELGEYFRAKPDPLNLQFIPTVDNISLVEMANYSPALQNLIDLGVTLQKIDSQELDYTYGFLVHLSQEDVASAIKFLSFDCGIEFEHVPKVLTYAPELLNPELNRIDVLKTVKYLKEEVNLDFSKLLETSGIGIRSIIEYQGDIGIGHLDYLLFKTKNMEVLELSGSGRDSDTVIALNDKELANLIYDVPEIIVPSFLTVQDVNRTIQLISRHLTKDFNLLELLIKKMPRELFYTRIYGENPIEPWNILKTIEKYNLENNRSLEDDMEETGIKPALLGYRFQSNWKMLIYDMQLSDEEIITNWYLLKMDPKTLQRRAHFLRLRKQTYVLFNKMAIESSDDDFCEFLGVEKSEYKTFLHNYFL